MTDLPLCPIIQAPRIIGYEECTISDESCAGKHERMIIWFDTFTFPQNSIPFLLCNFNFLNSILYAFWYNGEGKSHELWNYRWEDGMGRDMFCVPPCFVSTGNKCILLSAFSPIGANGPLNENNEELRMEHSIFSVPLSAAISDRKHAHRLRTSLAVSSFQTRSVGRTLVQP